MATRQDPLHDLAQSINGIVLDVDGVQLARIDAVDSLATAVLTHLLHVAEPFNPQMLKAKGRHNGPAQEEPRP